MKKLINKLLVLNKGELFGRIRFKLTKLTKSYDGYYSHHIKNIPNIELLKIFKGENLLSFNHSISLFDCFDGHEKLFNDESLQKKKWYLLSESMFPEDIRSFWEPGRMQILNIYVSNYIVTHDESFIKKIDDYLNKWFSLNPIDCGLNHISNLEIAIRFLTLYRVFYYAGNKLSIDLKKILYSYALHLYFDLPRTNLCVPNNHSLGEATSLLLASKIFNNKKWEKLASKTIVKRANLISNNGESTEESSGYQLFVTQMFNIILSITDRFDDILMPKFIKSKSLLYSISDASGNIGLFGDCDDGLFYNFDSLLKNNVKSIDCPFLKSYDKIKEKENMYGNNITETQYLSVIEKDVFKVAMIGGYEVNHSHTQSLSFLVWYKGRQIVFSSGNYLYGGAKQNIRIALASNDYSNSPFSKRFNRNNFVTKFRHKKIIKKARLINKRQSIIGEIKYKNINIIREIAFIDGGIIIKDKSNYPLNNYVVCTGSSDSNIVISNLKGSSNKKTDIYSPSYGKLSNAIYNIVEVSNNNSEIIIKPL